MRIHALFTCLLIMYCSASNAYGQDTLWVKHNNNSKYLIYQTERGEDLFVLAKRFKVPPARLADFNQTNFTDGLLPGSLVKIPVEKYNYYRINSVVKSKPIYHRVEAGETLRSISRLYNIPQSSIQEWNKLFNPGISAGDILQVGWMAYDGEARPFSHPDREGPDKNKERESSDRRKPESGISIDSSQGQDPVLFEKEKVADKNESDFEEEFYLQTNGYSLSTESGAAVFYPLEMQVNEGTYYAFHQNLARGTIIRIENPANGKVIYAKVIGSIPKINKYHNALIGLSNNAIPALSAKDKRMFCRISYR